MKRVAFLLMFVTSGLAGEPKTGMVDFVIAQSDPTLLRSLLAAKSGITAQERAGYLHDAQERREVAEQHLDAKRFSIKDILRMGVSIPSLSIAQGAIGLSIACAYLAVTDNPPIATVSLAAVLVSIVFGYYGYHQMKDGLTKADRVKNVDNALAVENLIHEIKPVE